MNVDKNPVKAESTMDFALALAHEVRNPLNNINLSIEMLESAMDGDEAKPYLDIIKRSSNRIKNLVNELLLYKKESQQLIENCSLYNLLEEVMEITEDRITLKNINVKRNYEAKDCKILMNKTEMKIALTNVIINAVEAMSPETGELRLETKSKNDQFVIQIEDNGCGISEDNLKHIFNSSYSNKKDGLGVGLSATREILEANRVHVHVESQEGSGTRFTLFFGGND